MTGRIQRMQMTKIARLLAILLISAGIISMGSLSIGAVATHPSNSGSGDPPAVEADSSPSVTCTPFGLYGDITTPLLVDRLSDSGDNLTFVGTSNGLYVLGLDGKLRHFLYSPFGVRFIALIDDINGDGIREVVVALNDTQVPALRCYDGATWAKLWQFAPAVRVWDKRWVDLQLSIADMEVDGGSGSQSIVLTAGRCVFSVDAHDGSRQWEFRAPHALEKVAAVADLNSDEVDELFVGSEEGDLLLLDGESGHLRWQTKLPECKDGNGNPFWPKVYDILAIDGEARRFVVTSKDGFARLFDLSHHSLEWETAVSGVQGLKGNLRMALAPDAGGIDAARVVVMEGSDDVGYTTSGCNVVLLDSAGAVVWKKFLPMWGHTTPELGSFGGKPVILESIEQQIKLINVADGESVASTIPVENLDKKAAMVKQLEGDRYLLVSSLGDMAMVSASGRQQWYYPRIDHITALNGCFVGDSTVDTLFCCEWDRSVRTTTYTVSPGSGVEIASSGQRSLQARSLQMMDGATRTIAWSYEIPPAELIAVGGVKGIRLAPDLVGSDNVPDIIGYRGDTIFIFSGRDGALSSFPLGQTITSVDIISTGTGGWDIAVGMADPTDTAYPREYGLLTIDNQGTLLWNATYAEWIADWIVDGSYSYSLGFTVLDDINSDNVSDLAIVYTSQIAILKSVGSTGKYELLETIPADSGWTIGSVEVVPDRDSDGIRELAYIQVGRIPSAEPGQPHAPAPCPFLCVQSPEDGRLLFKTQLDGDVQECKLACGDFNGDGQADSLLLVNLGGCGTFTGRADGGLQLQVVSGKDGAVLSSQEYQVLSYSWSGIGSKPLPATAIDDVNSDGADDLALVTDDYYVNSSEHSHVQTRLEIYGVLGDDPLDVIPASPSLQRNQMRYQEQDETLLLADVDHDGHREVIMSAIEPAIPYRPESANPFKQLLDRRASEGQVLAAIDPDSGRHLASITGFTPTAVSVFDTNQPDCMGLAARGCMYFTSLSPRLEVTSPASGARTGPAAEVRWEGTTKGDLVQVFVDGVCNYTGNDSGVDLQLSRGKHEIVVRSVDDYGRVSYGPPDLGSPLSITVTPSPWKPVLLILSLFVLFAVILLLSAPRLRRAVRARRRAARL